ncbi:MAG: hypothetical protein H6765_03990 [Candidatus Peribacteria bacterium]|nr:MAG: hypothetical protein H6765_03990 [Candidatus Peribacteria bacterium]
MSGVIKRQFQYIVPALLLALPATLFAQSELFKPMIDLSRSMQSWVEQSKEDGMLDQLPK